MRAEDQLLFLCTRQDFGKEHHIRACELCRSQKIRWEMLYAVADQHGVAPLVFTHIEQLALDSESGPPSQVSARFQQLVFQNAADKAYQADRLRGLLKFCQRHSVEVLLVKGAALDLCVYEQPWYTTAQDVDLIFKTSRSEISEEILKQFLEHVQGLAVEYDFFEHHDVNLNGLLRIDFSEIWARSITTELQGQKVRVMDPEDLLLSVCLNSCRKRFFRLKNLCDIREVIAHHSELNWGELMQRALKYQCANILYAALFACQSTVGCRIPDQFLEGLPIHPLRRNVIQRLSRWISRRSLSDLRAGRTILGRSVGWSLLLPYATYSWRQVGQKACFVWNTK